MMEINIYQHIKCYLKWNWNCGCTVNYIYLISMPVDSNLTNLLTPFSSTHILTSRLDISWTFITEVQFINFYSLKVSIKFIVYTCNNFIDIIYPKFYCLCICICLHHCVYLYFSFNYFYPYINFV